ncbi:hypothetical protein ELBR111191_14600 [Elizabethkingia bruuniana]|nr:hypothetical protein AYC65_02870 [Elizabethkingia bruuniana]OPB64445.1 hypothetical protein BAY12_06510 [Elizabethkingia bruuniana]
MLQARKRNPNFIRMKIYRRKPELVEVMEFTTNNEAGSPTMDAIVNWANQGQIKVQAWHNGTCIYVETPEGQKRADVGDFIIKNANGEFYPLKPEEFEKMYEIDGKGGIMIIGYPGASSVGVTGVECLKKEFKKPSKFQHRLNEMQYNQREMFNLLPKKPLITPPNLKK